MGSLRLSQLKTAHIGPVDLEVEAGECVCLSGPSGAGKSLLLRAIADLDPCQGDASLDGAVCARMPAPQWRRRVGLLPAESHWWSERVGDHFPDAVADGWLRRLGFDAGVMDWSVALASTGERQRLALLRLLSHGPEVLLLDEPTAALDPANVRAVEALVAEYRTGRRAPVLWVSHDPEQIGRVSTRHLRVEHGRLHEVSHR